MAAAASAQRRAAALGSPTFRRLYRVAPQRYAVDRAASLIPTPCRALCSVAVPGGLAALRVGTLKDGWHAAAGRGCRGAASIDPASIDSAAWQAAAAPNTLVMPRVGEFLNRLSDPGG